MHHDIELTKKGSAYALAAAACPPAGVHPAEWHDALARRVNQHLVMAAALLEVLDRLDGDCDFEPDVDAEPSLGGMPVGLPDGSSIDDCELDDADREWSHGIDYLDCR